ncbi:MAG: glycosyltransferase family 4 protein [Flavisolibacter sp.]|nr:glycosyltransferase family 4 protein [Flavisolibacter sp.]
MRIVSTSYSKTEEYSDPQNWLKRISFYTGILEELTKQHKVYSIERINYKGKYQQNGVDYYFIQLTNKVIRFPWKMHRLIKKLQPDVVLVNGFIFPLQIIQLRLTLGKQVKIIVLHRAEKPFSHFKKWLQALADKCVEAYLFTAAEFGKEWAERGIIRNQNKIHEVIQSSSFFRPESKQAARSKLGIDGAPIYLWVGRLEKNKDPLTVVKAFIRFHSVHSGARLYMIYQTNELLEEVKALINTNNQISEAIRLVGKVPHDALQSWYSGADFIVSGSHYEGSGIAVSEAMSCGCIPVVTDIISFRKMADTCGLFYKRGDENALVNVLEHTLALDIEKERKKVLDEFQKELSFAAIAKKINHIITEIT